MISYETAMGLSIAAPVLLAGSLNMREISMAQQHMWFVIPQVVPFVIYIISALAETNRIPFNLVEAEQELVAGFFVEYASMKFALFFLAEYANMILVSTLCATMFLGGWESPLPFAPFTWIPGILWLALKMAFLCLLTFGLEQPFHGIATTKSCV